MLCWYCNDNFRYNKCYQSISSHENDLNKYDDVRAVDIPGSHSDGGINEYRLYFDDLFIIIYSNPSKIRLWVGVTSLHYGANFDTT